VSADPDVVAEVAHLLAGAAPRLGGRPADRWSHRGLVWQGRLDVGSAVLRVRVSGLGVVTVAVTRPGRVGCSGSAAQCGTSWPGLIANALHHLEVVARDVGRGAAEGPR
jgi:hypothetical protein